MTTQNHHSIAGNAAIMTQKKQIGKIDQVLAALPFFKKYEHTISVLRLSGVIGKVGFKPGLSLEGLNDQIEKAFSFPKLSAVCMVINSPGGSPVQSELIAKRIITLSEEKKVPVYSFVEDVAASGGYWLACAGKEIYASRSSIVGSIGVISSGFGMHEAIKKLGIERRVYTEGKNKSVLDPFQPAKEDDIKIIRKLQHQIHEHFVDHVKTRRNLKLTQSDDILFSGEFWAGETAADFGLIDGIDDMYSFIKNKFGDDVKIEYVTPKQSWFKRKLSIASSEVASSLSAHLMDSAEERIMHSRFGFK